MAVRFESIADQVQAMTEVVRQLTEQVHPIDPKMFAPKTPKGMQDFKPRQTATREQAFERVTAIFKHHGAENLDTPVVELKELLTGKYDEDSIKLTYDLADQGGEILSLRYDLTVPFARYLAMHRISYIKRYQIGKVYRKDNPAMTKGRFREFFQCDFDIAGNTVPMTADVECVHVLVKILDSFELQDHVVKINHRKILDGLFEVCGVPDSQFKAMRSSMDRLDKIGWKAVRREMINKNGIGLSEKTADLIGQYVRRSGQEKLVYELLADTKLRTSKLAVEGLEALKLFFRYAEIYGIKERVKVDMSLARGLDYYTGIIFEAVLPRDNSLPTGQNLNEGFGSIAGGGRYDDLVSQFNPEVKIPCVGVSIGIERILAILESRQINAQVRSVETEVYVVAQKNLLEERMTLHAELLKNHFKTEMCHKANPQLRKQLQKCEDEQIPWAVIMGQLELKKGVVRLLHIPSRQEEQVERSKLVDVLKEKLEK